MGEINITSIEHHSEYKKAIQQFESLIGLESQKSALLSNLELLFSGKKILDWKDEFHPKGLTFLTTNFKLSPLILLSGDVGCGKTELASCVGSLLSKRLEDVSVKVFQSPSDIRGVGLVGQLSARITEVFNQVIADVKPDETGILIIDEADSLSNSREDGQQHLEDRAGVNTLIKELDRIENLDKRIAVLFITNRSKAMDPAILRRAAIQIQFQRPQEAQVKEVVSYLLKDVQHDSKQIENVVEACLKKTHLYTYSDFFRRIAHQSIICAFERKVPFSSSLLLEIIDQTEPSPLFKES